MHGNSLICAGVWAAKPPENCCTDGFVRAKRAIFFDATKNINFTYMCCSLICAGLGFTAVQENSLICAGVWAAKPPENFTYMRWFERGRRQKSVIYEARGARRKNIS